MAGKIQGITVDIEAYMNHRLRLRKNEEFDMYETDCNETAEIEAM